MGKWYRIDGKKQNKNTKLDTHIQCNRVKKKHSDVFKIKNIDVTLVAVAEIVLKIEQTIVIFFIFTIMAGLLKF